ncbi:hypothetical protein SprV_0100157300 [Sparganum proliferum]
MIERLYRQLRTSLCVADDPENRTNPLPLVLLGIRSPLKPELDCSVAELVLGAIVRIFGEIILPVPRGAAEDPTSLLHRLQQFMWTLSGVPPGPSVPESYLEKDFETCPHICLRCSQVRRSQEPPYDGPFRAISRETKTFPMQRVTHAEVASLDLLKAAVPYTPPDEPCGPLPTVPPPDPIYIRPVYSLFLYVCYPQLQLSSHRPPSL